MRIFDRIRAVFLPKRHQASAAQTAKSPEPLRSASDLDALLRATDCAAASSLVRRAARSCFHILPDRAATQAPVGSSRLGGAPDLPAGASWPTATDGRLLTFYGQINLEDLAPHHSPPLLPSDGLLSIFAGAIDSPTGSTEVRVFMIAPGVPLLPLPPPQGQAVFADERNGCLQAIRIRCDPGMSFPTESLRFLQALDRVAPDGDIDALLEGLGATPAGAVGQILGYAQFPANDVHREAYFAEIGRPNQGRLEIWEDWESWEEAKKMQSRMRNGQIYRPWSAVDDENLRWILANRDAIGSGIDRWHSVLWIGSNPLMNLWINDADPIYFLAKIEGDGRLDLSHVYAGATQS